MKLQWKIIVFLILICTPLYSQGNIKSKEKDSGKNIKTDGLFNLSYKFDEFEFYNV